MGKKGKEIVEVNVEELITSLNRALADEWLAVYQYWVGSKVVEGILRGVVAQELAQHAKEELEHAEKLTERITQLGGKPLLSPEDWYKNTNCGYQPPEDTSVKTLLKQNIEGERCAIEVYRKLLKEVEGKDYLTFNLLLGILEDEVEHEEDLEMILRDLEKVE